MTKSTINEKEVFDYLDTLRETGVTNMYTAGSWVQNAFSVDKKEAKRLLMEWMKYKKCCMR